MSKAKFIAIFIAAILVLLPGAAHAQAPFGGMKLLTRNTGWAVRGSRLYWTEDFGRHWRNITPPPAWGNRAIADVFFLDTSDGWVLLRISHSTQANVVFGDWGFELAHTSDAGASWSVRPVQLTGLSRNADLAGGGSLDFFDASHGWIDLDLVGSSSSSPGAIFSTNDGGTTWKAAWGHRVVSGPFRRNGEVFNVVTFTGAPGVSGRIRFITAMDGWFAGGPGGQDLYATHDGGKTWSRVTINAPAQFGHPTFITYDLPVFTDRLHGTVAVTYMSSHMALFATSDGGRTWHLAAAIPGLLRGGITPTASPDSELITARASGGRFLSLRTIGLDGRVRVSKGAIHTFADAAVWALSFRDARTGWALVGSSLYSTVSGGAAWTDITPGPHVPRISRHAAK